MFPFIPATSSSRPLLPLAPSSAAALALSFAICILASAAGIGGGAALVPLYLAAAGQTTQASVALSNLTILGSAVSAFALNARRWHTPATPPGAAPPPRRPLIDWDVILLMEPATIVGAVAGALLNAVAPPAVTLIGLSLLLVAVTHSVAAKARGVWLAETVAMQRAVEGEGGAGAASSSLTSDLRARLLLAGAEEEEVDEEGGGNGEDGRRPKPPPARGEGQVRDGGGGAASAPTSPKPPATLLGLPTSNTGAAAAAAPPPPPHPSTPPPLPLVKVGALVALFAVVLACDALKARLPCGSPRYWLATVGVVPPAAAVTVWARSRILATGTAPLEQAEADGGQLAWTPLNTLAIPAISTLAGLAAGAFGVGGGIIKGPFLILIARLPPEVAAASAMTMILFTSATASLVYLSAGAARPDWGGAVFVAGLAGSAVGVAGLAKAIAATGGRRSIVLIAMAATLGGSLLVTVFQAGVAVRGGEVQRGRLC